MYRFLPFLALVLLTSQTRAQTYVFDMYLFGDSVGHSVVSKTHDANGTDIYKLDTHIKAKVLWIIRENTTHYESTYKDGKMVSCNYYEINNGRKDRWSNIKLDGKVYRAETHHGKKTLTEVPTHSIGSLYCDGYDVNRKRFFYEPEADFLDLKFPEPNTVEFKSSDGNKSVYHFKNGQVADAEFHASIATVYLKRVK